MKRLLICGAAGAALIAGSAALAESPAPQPRTAIAAKVVTRAEVQAKVAAHFAKLDANRDGFVTKAELDTRKAERTHKRAERRAGRFDRIDANHDGSISRAEFEAKQARHQQRVAARDGNGDGRPDRRMRKMHHRMGGMARLGERMLAMADANRDSRVSLQEANAMALKHFDMADANRDGQVTRDERRQARQRMRSEHHGNHG